MKGQPMAITVDFSPPESSKEAWEAYAEWVKTQSVWYETNQGGGRIGEPDLTLVHGNYWQQETFWVTAEKQILLLTEMTTSHLRNTIAYLKRNSFWLQMRDHMRTWNGLMAPQGDMAQLAVEQAQDEEVDMELMHPGTYVSTLPLFQALEREYARR
jgi:hypothetical protein